MFQNKNIDNALLMEILADKCLCFEKNRNMFARMVHKTELIQGVFMISEQDQALTVVDNEYSLFNVYSRQ